MLGATIIITVIITVITVIITNHYKPAKMTFLDASSLEGVSVGRSVREAIKKPSYRDAEDASLSGRTCLRGIRICYQICKITIFEN